MNPEETFTQFCAEKYKGVFALYRMKFDLVQYNEVMNDFPYL